MFIHHYNDSLLPRSLPVVGKKTKTDRTEMPCRMNMVDAAK